MTGRRNTTKAQCFVDTRIKMYGNHDTEYQRTIQFTFQKCTTGTTGCPTDTTFLNYIALNRPAIWLYHNQKEFLTKKIGKGAISKSANIIQIPFESTLD